MEENLLMEETLMEETLTDETLMEANKIAEIRSHEASLRDGPQWLFNKPFGRNWDSTSWIKWATIESSFEALGIAEGARVLDVGVGSGWTSVFLGEAGYSVTGIDLAPACVEMGRRRADRTDVDVEFEVADMDDFSLGQEFDATLVFDCLHHSQYQERVISNVARHLRPGGWVLFGEPSILHTISPNARRVHQETGWIERGIQARSLRADCRKAGLTNFRRFHEGTGPYESPISGFAWQLVRLVAGNFAVAPQMAIWLAAQRPPH